LQVIYALLTQPELISTGISFADDSIHEIAYISGITPKTVKSTLKKLQELDYIRHKFRRYEIVDYVKLLERWELGYSETLRARLLLGKFSSIGKRTFSQLEAVLQESAYLYDYLIGGELAASIITEHLRPLGATLHLDETYKSKVAMMLRLKPDSAEGNILFMKRFGNEKQHFNNHLVHPLLIHAELVCSGNSRLKETAQIIYDKYIKR
jgi:hypothetical protein